MEKLAKFFYGLLIDDSATYSTFFTESGGLKLCFILMLAVAFGAAAIYYYVVAGKVSGATKANYLWTYIFGYIVLFFFTPLLFQLSHRAEDCDIWGFWTVFLYIGLVNALYYTVVYQLASMLLCNTPWTRANNITLLSIFK